MVKKSIFFENEKLKIINEDVLKTKKIEPESIDFGCLKPRNGANATLKLSGGPGQVIVHSDRLRVTPISFGSESTELQLTLLGGDMGELIWDDILLRGDAGELKVLVTGWWEEVIEPSSLESEPVSVPEPMPLKPLSEVAQKETQETEPRIRGNGTEERIFKGRACRWCGRNIRYDTNSHSWRRCHNCRGAGIVVSIILRMSKETYGGVKELRRAIVEIWEVLIGKQGRRT